MLIGRPKPWACLPLPLNRPDTLLTYSGTAAVYQAFRALNLAPQSEVLCPSYNCGHEIEPLLRLGLQVQCYRVTGKLEIDFADLERRIGNKTRAIMVIHYFGFVQPLSTLRDLCDRHQIFLVEDCAHALFSNNPERSMGLIGDAAVYSMRKSLPLPNGGAVFINNKELDRPDWPLRKPPWLSTWIKTLKLLWFSALDDFLERKSVVGGLLLPALLPALAALRTIKLLHPRSSVVCYNPDNESLNFSSEILSWSMAKVSKEILGRLDCSKVIEQRRLNYQFLVDALSQQDSCRVLIPHLPDGVCPLYLPIWVESPEQLRERLERQNIQSDVFWSQEHPAVRWSEFPEARDLKRHILILPVHQDIDATARATMVEVVTGQRAQVSEPKIE